MTLIIDYHAAPPQKKRYGRSVRKIVLKQDLNIKSQMQSPRDPCLVSRVLKALYGLITFLPKTHTAPLPGSTVGVQLDLTDVLGLCHL